MGLALYEDRHPNDTAQTRFDSLVGLDSHKRQLLDELTLLLDPARLVAWRKKHHRKGLPLVDEQGAAAPLILLSGEVGCGKTALALSVGTPLARRLDARVVTLETPSDIRGSGRVGELSARVTEAFSQAKQITKEVGRGILIIDEADDLATSRSQMQAHHEDRAGLNVLIKQIGSLGRDGARLAVIMITNRVTVLDPAVVRRAALQLRFVRPDGPGRSLLFHRLLQGTGAKEKEISELAERSERNGGVPYSYSDLTERVAKLALREAFTADEPLQASHFLRALQEVTPSPLIDGTLPPGVQQQ